MIDTLEGRNGISIMLGIHEVTGLSAMKLQVEQHDGEGDERDRPLLPKRDERPGIYSKAGSGGIETATRIKKD